MSANARPRDSHAEAFELEVEEAWYRLQCLGPRTLRTACYLRNSGRIQLRYPCADIEFDGEIGTFSRAIDMVDFRDACFSIFKGKSR